MIVLILSGYYFVVSNEIISECAKEVTDLRDRFQAVDMTDK